MCSILLVLEVYMYTGCTYTYTYMYMYMYMLCGCSKLLQSRLTLCDPIDHSPPGSSVRWISQARILECVAMPSLKGSSWPRDWTCISYISCIGRWVLYTSATWEAQTRMCQKWDTCCTWLLLITFACEHFGFDKLERHFNIYERK